MENSTSSPFGAIKVVECGQGVSAAFGAKMIADLGAEVIKVEPPGGDKTRRLPGLGIGFFRSFNRNKKSVVVDIQSEAGRATARELIGTSDVFLENFRPGLMASLGLDHASLCGAFPRLIYVSHKGFLPGPYEHRTALDEVVQMMGGLSYMTGPPGRPLRAGTSVNDIMGGMFGAIGVLAALRERDRTGRGQEVQSALFENCVFLSAQNMQQHLMTGEPVPPMPARVSSWSVYDVFLLKDDEQLFIGAVSDRQFQILCRVLEVPELAAEPALATNEQRVAARAELIPRLGAILVHHAVAELVPKLEANGLPYAPIVKPEQLVHDRHLKESGGLVPMQTEDGGTTDVVLLPITLGGRRLGVRRPLPRAGEDDDDILGALPSRRR